MSYLLGSSLSSYNKNFVEYELGSIFITEPNILQSWFSTSIAGKIYADRSESTEGHNIKLRNWYDC